MVEPEPEKQAPATSRITVRFDLPLDPRYRFTDEALDQLAESIVDKPVRVGQDRMTIACATEPRPGGHAAGDLLGKVTSARRDADRVHCTAELLADPPLVGALIDAENDLAFGVDLRGKARRNGDGVAGSTRPPTITVSRVAQVVGVAAFPARFRPPGAQPNVRVENPR